MSILSKLSKLIPPSLYFKKATVPALRINGPITPQTTLYVSAMLEKIPKNKNKIAVLVNSQGGCYSQAHIINKKIAEIAKRNGAQVWTFGQKWALNAGFMLLASGDRVFIDKATIVGGAEVGQSKFLAGKIGEYISTVTYADEPSYASELRKVDAFDPSKKEEIIAVNKRISEDIQAQIQKMRGSKLGVSTDLMNFYVGEEAVKNGLVDGIDSPHRAFGRLSIHNDEDIKNGFISQGGAISVIDSVIQIDIIFEMIMKERLLGEMGGLAIDTKWDQVLGETLSQLFEVKPTNPYIFLQRKLSLKQKLDNTKVSQYLLQLTMYLTHIDPLTTNEKSIRDKVMSLCVQKYQHTKIKKTQLTQVLAVMMLPFEGSKKDSFMKLVGHMLDHQIYSIIEYAEILYHAVIFRSIVEEVSILEMRLNDVKIGLTKSLLLQYINTVNEANSILKATKLELEGQDPAYKLIATQLCERINI